MLMVRLRLRTKQEAADSIPSVLASLLTWLVENRARLFLAVLGRRSASLGLLAPGAVDRGAPFITVQIQASGRTCR